MGDFDNNMFGKRSCPIKIYAFFRSDGWNAFTMEE